MRAGSGLRCAGFFEQRRSGVVYNVVDKDDYSFHNLYRAVYDHDVNHRVQQCGIERCIGAGATSHCDRVWQWLDVDVGVSRGTSDSSQ